MNRGVSWGLGIVLLLVMAFLAYSLLGNRGEKYTEEIELPRTGEAAYNKLYALKLALKAMGKDVDSSGTLRVKPYPKDAVIVLSTDVSELSSANTSLLQDFVAKGGKLLFSLPTDSTESIGLMEEIGWVEEQELCVDWKEEKLGSHEIESGKFCSERVVSLYTDEYDEDVVPLWNFAEQEDEYSLVRFARGDGEYYVADNLRFLENDAMAIPSNQAFSAFLLGPWLDSQQFFLIYEHRSVPWYVALVRYLWAVLIPLALALFAWAWARNQSIGPTIEVGTLHRNALREHLDANGEYLAKQKLRTLLVYELRERELNRMKRSDPGLIGMDSEAVLRDLRVKNLLTDADYQLLQMPHQAFEQEAAFVRVIALIQSLSVRKTPAAASKTLAAASTTLAAASKAPIPNLSAQNVAEKNSPFKR